MAISVEGGLAQIIGIVGLRGESGGFGFEHLGRAQLKREMLQTDGVVFAIRCGSWILAVIVTRHCADLQTDGLTKS